MLSRISVGACYECKLCKSDNENYCPKQVDTYNAKYVLPPRSVPNSPYALQVLQRRHCSRRVLERHPSARAIRLRPPRLPDGRERRLDALRWSHRLGPSEEVQRRTWFQGCGSGNWRIGTLRRSIRFGPRSGSHCHLSPSRQGGESHLL